MRNIGTVVGFRVLVKPEEIEKVSKGGILLEYGEKEDRLAMAVTTGTVVALGSQAYKSPDVSPDGQPWCKEGDRVMFGKYSGRAITHPDTEERLLVMNDVDILAVLPPKEEKVDA